MSKSYPAFDTATSVDEVNEVYKGIVAAVIAADPTAWTTANPAYWEVTEALRTALERFTNRDRSAAADLGETAAEGDEAPGKVKAVAVARNAQGERQVTCACGTVFSIPVKRGRPATRCEACRTAPAPAKVKAPTSTGVKVKATAKAPVITTGSDHPRTCRKCGKGFVVPVKRGRPPVCCETCR